jgi:hypothetical protein
MKKQKSFISYHKRSLNSGVIFLYVLMVIRLQNLMAVSD